MIKLWTKKVAIWSAICGLFVGLFASVLFVPKQVKAATLDDLLPRPANIVVKKDTGDNSLIVEWEITKEEAARADNLKVDYNGSLYDTHYIVNRFYIDIPGVGEFDCEHNDRYDDCDGSSTDFDRELIAGGGEKWRFRNHNIKVADLKEGQVIKIWFSGTGEKDGFSDRLLKSQETTYTLKKEDIGEGGSDIRLRDWFKDGKFVINSSVWKEGTCGGSADNKNAPEITIQANSSIGRPAMTFRLSSFVWKSGAMTVEDTVFYFKETTGKYLDPSLPDRTNLAIKVLTKSSGEGTGSVVFMNNEVNYQDDEQVSGTGVEILIEKALWMKFLNRVYNAPNASGTTDATCGAVVEKGKDPSPPNYTAPPDNKCLNQDANGWLLGCWGVTGTKASNTNPLGTDDYCGVSGNFVTRSIASVLCSILGGLAELGKWIINGIFADTFDALAPVKKIIAQFNPSEAFFLSTAHAQTQSKIRAALTADSDTSNDWVRSSWKVILALANVFVIFVLLFLAVVNIMHIQYDTYAIKKALPLLILGIILANFSLLIVRMFVDVANVLTNTFMGGDPGTAIEKVITAVIPQGKGAYAGVPTNGIGTLLLAVIFALFAIIVFVILGFLFYVRYVVILALAIAAPLAFILYAFPPTSGLFKQWWGWFSKFVFMKPISFFFIFLATQIIEVSRGSMGISVWAIVVFLMIAAIIVPFKLGGGVMGAWGKVGKWATGTKEGGFLRKPLDNFVQSKKDAWKQRANNWVNKNTALGRWRAGHDLEMETLKAEGEAIKQRRQVQIRKKKAAHQALREAEIASANSELETEKTLQTLKVEQGDFNHISKRQMRKITGLRDPMDVAQKYVEQANRLAQAQEGLNKRRSLDLQNLSIRDLEEDDKFRKTQLAHMPEIDADQFDESGHALAKGKTVQVTWARAIEVAEELRFKAKSTTDAKEREQYLQASRHYDNLAKNYQATNKTDASGKKVEYEAYLSRNLSGRRQKVLNPAVNDEAETDVLSDSAEDLIDDTAKGNKTFGSSEWRANQQDMDNALTGNIHLASHTARMATCIRIRAIHKNMLKARHGDYDGLVSVEKFSQRVGSARGVNFKAETGTAALDKMNPTIAATMGKNILTQAAAVDPKFKGKTWDKLSAAEKEEAFGHLDFTKLDTTSTGGGPAGQAASANRAFIDRYVKNIEADKKLGLSGSPGKWLKSSVPR